MKQFLIPGLLSFCASLAVAKLPPPDDAAKAKAAEAGAKAAWQGKVDAYELCKVQDRIAAQYKRAAGTATPNSAKTAPVAAAPASAAPKAAGGAPMASPSPGCADPGPFAYNPPGQKSPEPSVAHSPAGAATSPPSVKPESAQMAPAKK
jgi:hypothetical protein